jgi:hypothetical protein
MYMFKNLLLLVLRYPSLTCCRPLLVLHVLLESMPCVRIAWSYVCRKWPPLFSRPVRGNGYGTALKRRRLYRTMFLEREMPYGTGDDVSGPYRARTVGFPRVLKRN